MKSALLFLNLVTVVPCFAGSGFYPPNTKGVPPPVAQSADKVLRYIRLSSRAIAKVDAKDIPSFEKLLRGNPQTLLAQLNIRDPRMIQFWLNDLKSWDRSKDYVLHNGYVASAYFLEPGLLVTARHVVTSGNRDPKYLSASTKEEAADRLQETLDSFLLLDKNDRVLVDTRGNKEAVAEVLFSGHPLEVGALPSRYQGIENTSRGQLCDLVAMKLNKFDASDYQIKLAPSFPKVGERVFGIGYPLPTTRRMAHDKAPDADGTLRLTYGEVKAAFPEDYESFLKKIMPKESDRQAYLNGLTLTNLDFMEGISGGPIVNAAGEAVSLASTVRHDPKVPMEEYYTVTLSYGPRLSLLVPLFRK